MESDRRSFDSVLNNQLILPIFRKELDHDSRILSIDKETEEVL